MFGADVAFNELKFLRKDISKALSFKFQRRDGVFAFFQSL